jgi:hypothetical protein
MHLLLDNENGSRTDSGKWTIMKKKKKNCVGIVHQSVLVKEDQSPVQASYRTIHTWLSTAGLHPKLQQLDNEASVIIKDYMTKKNNDC